MEWEGADLQGVCGGFIPNPEVFDETAAVPDPPELATHRVNDAASEVIEHRDLEEDGFRGRNLDCPAILQSSGEDLGTAPGVHPAGQRQG